MAAAVLPSPLIALSLTLAGAVWAASVGLGCGALKLQRGVRTGFTRKLFHFAIFTGAMAIHVAGGFPWVNASALGVVAVILWGVWRGDGHPIFEGMARERDAPQRAFYVIVPLITTALGGLASNALAGDFALVGYLVCGWGDAIGEPAGAWLGRHPYRVPSLTGIPCVRTFEGSAAVGLAAFLAALLALAWGMDAPLSRAALHALLIALATVPIEALSPHGSDNFTVMVGASLMALGLMNAV